MKYRVKINYLQFIFSDKAEALDFMEQAVMAYLPCDSEEVSVRMEIVFEGDIKKRGE